MEPWISADWKPFEPYKDWPGQDALISVIHALQRVGFPYDETYINFECKPIMYVAHEMATGKWVWFPWGKGVAGRVNSKQWAMMCAQDFCR